MRLPWLNLPAENKQMKFVRIALSGIPFLLPTNTLGSYSQSQGGHNNIIKLILIKKVLNFVNPIKEIK
jgi:hypothetical protein